MNRKVLVFFPQNPYPTQSGFHKRGLEMIEGLRENGCEITLASSILSASPVWNESSVQHLKGKTVKDVRIYKTSAFDRRFLREVDRYHNIFKKVPPFDSVTLTPPGMRLWFSRIIQELEPDFVLMNYAYWDGLINHRRFKSIQTIIDTIDLLTLNRQMWQALQLYLPSPPIDANEVDEEVLKEDFFEKLNFSPLPQEFEIYDKYDHTIMITQQEADIVKRNTHRTKVTNIPMTQEPCYIPNKYTGPALLPTGPNPFNVQGYLYFVKKVLPTVRDKATNFCLQVTGYCSEQCCGAEGVLMSGFVPDINSVYETARFVVCPIVGGTGQQVKIVESMARGVPVIALRAAAIRSPMEHGVNGLIADNAEEFAEHVIRLWNDTELCRKLGNAARETVSSGFSRVQLAESLSHIVDLRKVDNEEKRIGRAR